VQRAGQPSAGAWGVPRKAFFLAVCPPQAGKQQLCNSPALEIVHLDTVLAECILLIHINLAYLKAWKSFFLPGTLLLDDDERKIAGAEESIYDYLSLLKQKCNRRRSFSSQKDA